MARKSLKPVAEKIEGSFLDVKLPEFDWIKVDLTHNRVNWTDSKTNIIEKVEDNYNIVINLSEKTFSEDKELSSKIKEICHLSFPPYYWKEKSYRFYTTERTGSIEERKEILVGLLNLLKNYELDKTNQFDASGQVFKEDAKNKIKLESVDLLMKFHEPTQRFIVLAKDFLGSEKFALLRKCSEYSSQLSAPSAIATENKFLITTDFFAEDLPNKKIEKKTYFFINPSFYEEIKHHFSYAAKQQEEFIEKQKQVCQENDLSQYNIENENVFGLKIKFNKEHQCFEFYGKGYYDNVYEGRHTPRGLVPLWALNFIYSKEKDTELNLYPPPDMMIDKDKIELEEVKGGTKREKNIRIPATEWPKIKLIKENFEKEMAVWGRPEKSIKITHCEFSSSILERYPAVYFDNKGKSYLAFGSRKTGMFRAIGESSIANGYFQDEFSNQEETNGKKQRNIKFSQTLKTIPISFEEANFFMNEHPFAEDIKRGTLDLNSRIHGPVDNLNMTYEEKQKVFDTVYLHAQLQSQADKLNDNKPKPKRMKI